jgi:hypothetical protein
MTHAELTAKYRKSHPNFFEACKVAGTCSGSPCPLCDANRTEEEQLMAHCNTCRRDTWEDHNGVNQFKLYLEMIGIARFTDYSP